jgi:hypothetical protein
MHEPVLMCNFDYPIATLEAFPDFVFMAFTVGAVVDDALRPGVCRDIDNAMMGCGWLAAPLADMPS